MEKVATPKRACAPGQHCSYEHIDETEDVISGWSDAGALTELQPGNMRRVDVCEEPILLANVDGRYVAVADTCTHEDASLSRGALQGACVRCPLHGSRFCLLDGKAIDEPAEIDLKTYAVRIKRGRILIQVDR